MMSAINVLAFLLVSLSIAAQPTQAQEGSACALPNGGGQSTCTRLLYCDPLWGEIKKSAPNRPSQAAVDRIKQHFCGTSQQLVCCPSNTAPLPPIPVTAATAPPPLIKNPSSAGLNLPPLSDLNQVKNHRNFDLINKKCGSVVADRIVGGQIAVPGEFPWMTLLQFKSRLGDSFSFNCGGALISPYYVLTAAHCVNRDLVAVRLGEHDLSKEEDCNANKVCQPPVQDIQIETAFKHKGFDNSKKINDIALLRLKAPADITKKNVKTICLPTNADIQISRIEKKMTDKMAISGWGRVETGNPSDVLMRAFVPYITNAECIKKFGSKIPIHDTYLCAGGANKTDTCQGDSGGPIQTFATLDNKPRMVLYGVVSVGVECLNPDVIYPGIYTNVAYYLDWILDNMTR